MEINLASIRQEYTKGGLRESELPDNPFLLFSQWLQEAIDSKVDEPTAMLVGTVSPEGKPSTRTVLLKDLHDDKFIFYSNYESRKGRQLAQNPAISLSFVWHQLERQVHMERPAHWGGYAVIPERIEFWQGRPNRLHDRIVYTLQPDGHWKKERLAP